jgi:hypothetical protein
MVYSLRNLDLGMTTTKRGILFFQRLIDFEVRKRTCGGFALLCLPGSAQSVGELLRKGSSGSAAKSIY